MNATSNRKPLTVLMVDEERQLLEALRTDLLAIFGSALEFVLCPSGPDALRVAARLGEEGALVPLVVADLEMPGMNGLAFLRPSGLCQGRRFATAF